MHIKFHLLTIFIAYTLRVGIVAKDQNAEKNGIPNFCFNASLEGFRLNVTVFMRKVVPDWLACVLECVTEPCCRSINYKNTLNLQNESNCEMLHNMVYNISQEFLEANFSYNHVYLNNPHKEYNEKCFPKFPNHKFKGVSKILQNEPKNFANKLKEWLPKTGYWSLCWRATRDGWAASTFHSKCDGKSPTITIVQVINNNKKYIFGGYATEPWDINADYFTSAPGSFLFSLRNHDDLPPFKAPLKDENSGQAIFLDSENGPTFGGNFDLHIANNAKSNAQSFTEFGGTYQAPSGYTYKQTNTQSLLAGSFAFTPSEIEVLNLNE